MAIKEIEKKSTRLLTFILPVFNASKHINTCMSSFEQQTKKDFMVLFVDDCSTDDTVALILSYKEKSHFDFEVCNLPSNSGPGVARNIGVAIADTEYISFVDVDDTLSPNFCEALMDVAKTKNSDVVISSAYKKWDDGRIKKHYDIHYFERLSHEKELLVSQLDVGPWGKIIKKSLWYQDTEFPKGIRAEDLASIPVIYLRSESISFCEDAKYYYRQTQNSRSRAGGQHYNDIFEAYKVLASRINSDTLKEYYAVTRIGYGVIMNLIKTGDVSSLSYYRNYLIDTFPNGLHNKFFKYFPWQKRIFITLVYWNFVIVLKYLVRLFASY